MGKMTPDYSVKGSGNKGARINRGNARPGSTPMTPDYSSKGSTKGAKVERGK